MGQKRRRQELTPFSQHYLISLFLSLSEWYFSGFHRNSSVTACAVDGGGFRLDVWQWGTRQQRYLRNAFLGSPLWGNRGESQSLPPCQASKVGKSPLAFRCL